MRYLAVLLTILAALYFRFGRPHILNWGARPEETQLAMPGDEVLQPVDVQTTRAITINASPEYVWPWLLQMGPRPRGGVYTYDWIENLFGLDIASVDVILPEFQHLEPGDYLGLNQKQGLRVLQVLPLEALVLRWEPAGSTWAFGLYRESGNRTRLVSRNRIQGSGFVFRLVMLGFMEAGSLVMERGMLRGIKRRAERLAVQSGT